jgi:hypothetical protein
LVSDATNGSAISLRAYTPTIEFNNRYNGTNIVAFGSGYTAQLQLETSTGDYRFLTGNNPGAGSTATFSEKMRITNAGNVGIGTTSPGYPLHVEGSSTSPIRTYLRNTNAAGSSSYTMGTDSYPISAAVFSNGSTASGYGGANALNLINVPNAPLALGTNNTVQLTILGNGNVGIGTDGTGYTYSGKVKVLFDSSSGHGVTIKTSSSTNSYGPIVFENSAAGLAGWISYGPGETSVNYNTSSDRRLKENIAPTAKGLSTLMEVPVSDFNFIADPGKTRVQGFIAQEVYNVYPEAVAKGDDDVKKKPWAVDYGRLTPLIVKAVQDIKNLFDGLAAEVKQLAPRVDEAFTKLAAHDTAIELLRNKLAHDDDEIALLKKEMARFRMAPAH